MDSAAAFPASIDVQHTPTDGNAAISFEHHLSELAKARRPSPLKSFAKFQGVPGLISLAGGLPDPSYFPFETLSGSLLSPERFDSLEEAPKEAKRSWFSSIFGGSSDASKPKTGQITVPKYAENPTPTSVQLSTALQYGGAQGLVFLQNFLKEWTSLVSMPAYTDWDVLLDDGATDGWHKVLELLCNPGDPVLVEAWTYPSAIESGWPMGVRPVPIAIDAEGINPEALDKTLSEWNVQERGTKKPSLLYTVPVGQNPTGSIITTERRKKVYAVCVKHDVIIAEDDPYYILQFLQGQQQADNGIDAASSSVNKENRQFIKSLSPSYLKFDYQGRVIRLDTFSKTVAPGSRLGWITSNARFSERLLRASETSTQQPSGFTQVMVAKVLETWGMDGWIRWLRGLRAQYQERRDVTVDALQQGFKIETIRSQRILADGISRGPVKMVGYVKYDSSKRTPLRTFDLNEKFSTFGLSEGRPPLISFSPPDGGMFVWINVHVSNHKSFDKNASPSAKKERTRILMNELWEELAQNSVLIAPGWMFNGDGLRSGAPDSDQPPSPKDVDVQEQLGALENDDVDGVGHFRLAFSFSTHETLRKGVKIFCETVTEFFE